MEVYLVFIKSKNKTLLVRGVILAVLLTLMGAGPALAAQKQVCLVAKQFNDPITGVPMWGYGELPYVDCGGNLAARLAAIAAAVPSVPGPRIEVPPGDRLVLRLLNGLSVPTSFGISGMTKRSNQPLAPVLVADANGRDRIRSLDKQLNPNGRTHYQFAPDQPGTVLYGSVTHMQVQRQMGLYGAVTQDEAAGVAYPDNPDTSQDETVTYDAEEVLLYSEVDPALHAAVADGTYGTTGPTSTLGYNPTYFLLNGEHRPYVASGGAGALDIGGPAVAAGDDVLLRILNAGLRTVMPNVSGLRCSVVAEDGNAYPYPRDQYSVEVWAGSTRDCIVNSSTGGTFPIVERRSTGLNGTGGQLAFLTIDGPAGGGNALPVAVDDPAAGNEAAFTVAEESALAPGANVLDNDTDVETVPLTVANLVSGPANAASFTFPGDGSFTYTPELNFSGTDSFTYTANDGTDNSNVARAFITVTNVNDAPVAVNDFSAGAPLEVSSTTSTDVDVVANDTDVDGDSLTAAAPTLTVGAGTLLANPDGTVTYTPAGHTGAVEFTYTAFDGTLNSVAPATVFLTVPSAVVAPVANNNSAWAPKLRTQNGAGTRNTCFPVFIGLVGDDTPGTAAIDLSSVVIVSGPSLGGTVSVSALGVADYQGPLNIKGTETFTYTVDDINGVTSNVATVSVNIVGQRKYKREVGLPASGQCGAGDHPVQ